MLTAILILCVANLILTLVILWWVMNHANASASSGTLMGALAWLRQLGAWLNGPFYLWINNNNFATTATLPGDPGDGNKPPPPPPPLF